MMILDTESFKSAITKDAINHTHGRIATYSFDPSGWAGRLLSVAESLEVYISMKVSPKEIISRIPLAARKHKFYNVHASHLKLYAFKDKRSYVAYVGSMNFTETYNKECCCRFVGTAAEKFTMINLRTKSFQTQH